MNNRIKILLAIIVLCIGIILFPFFGWDFPGIKTPLMPSPVPSINNDPLSDSQLWNVVQEWRTKNNYNPYKKDQRLCEVANKRLVEVQTIFDHTGFYKYIGTFPKGSYIGENLAMGIYSNNLTLEGWLESPHHKENLEKPFEYSCIATKNGYSVQIFANF